MLERGLIEEPEQRPDPDRDDERRCYYRLTDLGGTVLAAETVRLGRLVALARQRGLRPARGSAT